eukprot:126834-Alexandrium_andersonii.AAC.1
MGQHERAVLRGRDAGEGCAHQECAVGHRGADVTADAAVRLHLVQTVGSPTDIRLAARGGARATLNGPQGPPVAEADPSGNGYKR